MISCDLSWISNIRHSALISSPLEILPVSGSIISGHAHTRCAQIKPGRPHGSVQTCDCTHCKHFSSSCLDAPYPQLQSSVATAGGQKQGVSEELSCTPWNRCHSDPSCRVHTVSCCGVPVFQPHSTAGFCLFSTSLNFSSFWDLMNRSVSETMPCYSFLLGFKIKQEEHQGLLKWKVCIQIVLLLTYL